MCGERRSTGADYRKYKRCSLRSRCFWSIASRGLVGGSRWLSDNDRLTHGRILRLYTAQRRMRFSLMFRGIEDEAQRIPARGPRKHTYPYAESSPCSLFGHASVPQRLVPSSPHTARTRSLEGYSVRSKRCASDEKSSPVSMSLQFSLLLTVPLAL